jgi:ubiquitin-like 1-activating enzyme E1 A
MKTEYKKETRTRTTVAAKETKEGDTTWEFVSKHEAYVPLSEAIKCTIDKTWRLRKKKAVPPVLPGVKALWKFHQQESRLPEAKTEDYAKFTLLMTEANNELGLPRDLVSAPFIRFVFLSCLLLPEKKNY